MASLPKIHPMRRGSLYGDVYTMTPDWRKDANGCGDSTCRMPLGGVLNVPQV